MKRFFAAAVIMSLLGAGSSSPAGTIGSVNNGDLSAGDTRNWTIEQNGGVYIFAYQDVGVPYNGTLHTQGTSNGYGSRAWHTTLCDVGSSGAIQFKINSLGNSGAFAVCFLGDPVYSGGGVPLDNNNDAKRGYYVQLSQGYGTFSAKLSRKAGGWARTDLATWSAPYSTITSGWHTLAIRDNFGNISVSFDGQTILQATEGANYLPTAYAADYANGGFWGVFMQNNVGAVDVNFDNLMVGGAPAAVSDLSAAPADWYRVNLSWTAPSDFPPGPVAGYDIRYSTSSITDANWAGATQCTGEPAGATPGQAQTFSVTGLQANTTYYFAMKAIGGGGQASPLSNVPNTITQPLDVVAPAAVTDLSPGDIRSSRATLSWTATGDDGTTGTASQYDIRYSTNSIDASNFAGATQATSVPVPKISGSVETFVLRGLAPTTTYYVAIKTADEVPNWSTMSNVVSFTTPAADLTPPTTIADLKLTGAYIRSAYLSWTAPSDSGGTGTGAYDVRYSTSPITDASWASAIPVGGMPVPAAPGTKENVTVGGLNPDTTYYFALKTLDQAEPPNVSVLSNVVSGKTMPPIPAVTIHNPWIVNDRVADCRTLNTMAATFDKAYTPDGVIVPSPSDTETRVINNYNNFKRRLYHWGEMPPPNADVGYQLNIFGWALCGSQASMNAAIIKTMGLSPRTISIASGGHTYMEVNYGGKWHAIDTMCTYYVYDRGSPRSLASMADVKADKNLVYNAVAEGRACPGFLLCGDTPDYFATGADTWQVKATPGDSTTSFSANMDIRMGETVERTWESWVNQWPTTSTTPPYHHEANKDYKDTVNINYWEPYQLTSAQNTTLGITMTPTYRRWANGTVALAPDFRSAGYQASLASSANIATFNDDGLTPDLHPATTGALATAVFKIATPFYITDGTISGTFFKNAAGDTNRLYVSTDGTTFTKVWDNAATGTTQLGNLSVRPQVRGQYAIWVKVELQAAGAKTNAGVSNLVITPIFEHNKGGMAYLDKGVNNITVTMDNPQDLAAGATFRVTYKWKEFDGTDWTVSKTQDQYIAASPTTFTITTGGTKVPRTESITMSVQGPLYDPLAPGAVTDLAATPVGATKVALTWHATANDGYDANTGAATAYDLRYSISPVTDDASFAAATKVTGVPSPKASGSAEIFTVTGLQAGTVYYFGLKVLDTMNASDLSNVPVSATTPLPPQPPNWVGDLKGTPSTTGSGVDLTWTAPAVHGADGSGPFAAGSYDLRYSTSPILYNDGDATWNAAAKATGLTSPKAPGSSESFTIAGLAGGIQYYFALKAANEVGAWSEASNCAAAKASTLGQKVLQAGNGCTCVITDTFMEASAPTAPFDNDHIRICGYGAGTTNVQRGLIKFDMSTAVPAGTVITSATLGLYAYDAASLRGSTGFYGVYPLTRAFDETAATWNKATSSVSWTVPGGDFINIPDATSPKQAVVNVWYNFDVTARVQQWIASSSSNLGWLIACTDENKSNQDMFYSCDTSNAAYRPKLVVSDLQARKVGDINSDNYVNVGDLQALVGSWAKTSADRSFEPWADINSDGTVNVGDLQLLVVHWGQ